MATIVSGATVWLATPSFAGNPPLTTTITTMATPAAVLGGTIQDVASLSFAAGTGPTGTVTFRSYGPNDMNCVGPPVFTSGAQPVSGVGSPRTASASFAPVAPGTYRWTATYSGDVNYASIATACNDSNETSIVSASPSTTTTTAMVTTTTTTTPIVTSTSTTTPIVTSTSSTTTTTPTVTSTSTTTINPYPLAVTPPSGSGGLASAATPQDPSGSGGYEDVGLAVAAMVAAQLILSARLRRRRAQAA